MSDENTSLLLQLISKYPAIIYIVGLFMAIVSGVYISNVLKTLFPVKKEDDKKDTSESKIVVVNSSDNTLERFQILAEAQAELIESQRELLKGVVKDIMRQRSLDDTIPYRDEILDKLDELLDDKKE